MSTTIVTPCQIPECNNPGTVRNINSSSIDILCDSHYAQITAKPKRVRIVGKILMNTSQFLPTSVIICDTCKTVFQLDYKLLCGSNEESRSLPSVAEIKHGIELFTKHSDRFWWGDCAKKGLEIRKIIRASMQLYIYIEVNHRDHYRRMLMHGDVPPENYKADPLPITVLDIQRYKIAQPKRCPFFMPADIMD